MRKTVRAKVSMKHITNKTNKRLDGLSSFRPGALLIVAGLLLFMTGCVAREYRRIGDGGMHTLTCETVPPIAEEDPACGPQAVAQVCKFWGIEVDERDLIRHTLDATNEGARLGALREWAQQSGLNARLYHGSPQDLAEKLSAGMPVIAVLNVNPYPGIPHPLIQKNFWGHAVVVTGFDDGSQEVILCEAEGESRVLYNEFLEDWEAADWMTLLVWPDIVE
ncbi:MAG: hypothetical protein Kow0099_11790 [Candidatus Abyssubacteria bacterium]